MSTYESPLFDRRIMELSRGGRTTAAADELRAAIEEAVGLGRQDDACHLYSRLATVYRLAKDDARAASILEECETRFPDNFLAKWHSAETAYWSMNDPKRAIAKAERILHGSAPTGLVNQARYLIGLAYLDLGDAAQAIEMLKQTDYLHLSLPEKLLERGLAHAECREFLRRARARYETYRARGEDVADGLRKVEELLSRIGEGRSEK